MPHPLFTVFTPTYNRAHTIGRVYESLRAQTFRDLEWLVVDDGSKDNTREVVEGFAREAGFPIRYVYKENGGKHTARNLAVKHASGELFLVLDSDDSCVARPWSASPSLAFHPGRAEEGFFRLRSLQNPIGKDRGEEVPRMSLSPTITRSCTATE
jgi:GT2 family glycosyltransferase